MKFNDLVGVNWKIAIEFWSLKYPEPNPQDKKKGKEMLEKKLTENVLPSENRRAWWSWLCPTQCQTRELNISTTTQFQQRNHSVQKKRRQGIKIQFIKALPISKIEFEATFKPKDKYSQVSPQIKKEREKRGCFNTYPKRVRGWTVHLIVEGTAGMAAWDSVDGVDRSTTVSALSLDSVIHAAISI